MTTSINFLSDSLSPVPKQDVAIPTPLIIVDETTRRAAAASGGPVSMTHTGTPGKTGLVWS